MQQSAEVVMVRLGAVHGQQQAQLDGFKTRALRAKVSSRLDLRTQRQWCYETEWCLVSEKLQIKSGHELIGAHQSAESALIIA